jgi:hypothetical protein
MELTAQERAQQAARKHLIALLQAAAGQWGERLLQSQAVTQAQRFQAQALLLLVL